MTDPCRTLADEIPLLLDQELPRRRAAQTLSHLARCARCRGESQSLAQTWLALDESSPAPAAPAQLRAWRPQGRFWTFEGWPARALAMAAACAALWLVLPPRRPAPAADQQAAKRLLPEPTLPLAELPHPPLRGGDSANLSAPPSLRNGDRPALAAAPLAGELSGAVPILPPQNPRPNKPQRRHT